MPLPTATSAAARRRIPRRAFTLVELLVVVAIISILGALLLPVFAQARGAARRARCASNIRQIGSAVMMYNSDYDELMPLFLVNPRRWSWAVQLQPYLRSWQLFRCPGMADATTPAGRSIWAEPYNVPANLGIWQSYGWNVDYLNRAQPDCSDWNRTFPLSGPPVSLSEIAEPSATVLAVGVALAPGKGSRAGTAPWFPVNGGYYIAYAPASRGPTSDVCTSRFGGWGQGSELGPYGGFEQPRHQTGGNVAFVDGHVRHMRASELASGTNWTPSIRNTDVIITDRCRYLWDLE